MHNRTSQRHLLLGLFLLGLFLFGSVAASAKATPTEILAKSILKELVEINTTDLDGDNTKAAKALAKRLLDAGLPADDVHVIEPVPGKGNLVARLRSPAATKQPILLLAHIDVVAANPEDWTVPPFTFLERDGYYYGRGTTDDKDEAAIHTANLIRWHQEGFKANRDIIIALTADEEGGDHNGVQYLLEHHRELVDAAFALNEGGGGTMRQGVPKTLSVQAAEKVYQSYTLEVTNRGGHSSLPRSDNAINELARALLAIEAHQFPIQLNEITRAMLRQSSANMTPALANQATGLLASPPTKESVAAFSAIPAYNARLRTTCVATQLSAGHAENALPQRATATVNCRILPGSQPAQVHQTLLELSGDGVAITPIKTATPSPPSPLNEDVLAPIMAITEDMWSDVVVIPTLSTGATDGLFFRNAGIPVYGVSGLFNEENDYRAHGRDERIQEKAFYDGLEFLNRLVKAYSTN